MLPASSRVDIRARVRFLQAVTIGLSPAGIVLLFRGQYDSSAQGIHFGSVTLLFALLRLVRSQSTDSIDGQSEHERLSTGRALDQEARGAFITYITAVPIFGITARKALASTSIWSFTGLSLLGFLVVVAIAPWIVWSQYKRIWDPSAPRTSRESADDNGRFV